MIVNAFKHEDKETFFALCKMFYEARATFSEFDKVTAERTFLRVMDHHENLWGYMFFDKEKLDPVGYALVTSYWSNEEGGVVIVLDEIFINPTDRSKGYAKSFMAWLEEHFSYATSITLEVLATNETARRFYEKLGYTPDGYISYTKKPAK